MKAWFVYKPLYGERRSEVDCYMILENGWIPSRHTCSDAKYVRWVLWDSRESRQLIFKIMDIEIEDMGVIEEDKLPAEIAALSENSESWRDFADRYCELLGENA